MAQPGDAALPERADVELLRARLGSNVIWVDPEHDLVAVVRWIEPTAVDGFMSACWPPSRVARRTRGGGV